MIDRLVTDSRRHVSDARDAEHFQIHVSGNDRFRNSAHSDCVSAKISHQVNLSGRLVIWAGKRAVNSAPYFNPDGFRFFNNYLLELRRVDRRHVRKTWAKPFIVWATEGIVAH